MLYPTHHIVVAVANGQLRRALRCSLVSPSNVRRFFSAISCGWSANRRRVAQEGQGSLPWNVPHDLNNLHDRVGFSLYISIQARPFRPTGPDTYLRHRNSGTRPLPGRARCDTPYRRDCSWSGCSCRPMRPDRWSEDADFLNVQTEEVVIGPARTRPVAIRGRRGISLQKTPWSSKYAGVRHIVWRQGPELIRK